MVTYDDRKINTYIKRTCCHIKWEEIFFYSDVTVSLVKVKVSKTKDCFAEKWFQNL